VDGEEGEELLTRRAQRQRLIADGELETTEDG